MITILKLAVLFGAILLPIILQKRKTVTTSII